LAIVVIYSLLVNRINIAYILNLFLLANSLPLFGGSCLAALVWRYVGTFLLVKKLAVIDLGRYVGLKVSSGWWLFQQKSAVHWLLSSKNLAIAL
jgi:hypothetical protein